MGIYLSGDDASSVTALLVGGEWIEGSGFSVFYLEEVISRDIDHELWFEISPVVADDAPSTPLIMGPFSGIQAMRRECA